MVKNRGGSLLLTVNIVWGTGLEEAILDAENSGKGTDFAFPNISNAFVLCGGRVLASKEIKLGIGHFHLKSLKEA